MKKDKEAKKKIYEEAAKRNAGRPAATRREDKPVKSPEETRLVTATFHATSKGFGFAETSDENGDFLEEIFIPASAKKGAWDGDTVLVRVLQEKSAEKKAEGIIERVDVRAINYVVGTFQKSKNFGFVVPDDRRMEEDIFIQKEHTKGAVDGHKVYVKITSYGGKNKRPEGRVTEILGHMDDPHTDLKTALRAFNIFPEFPMDVVEEANVIPDEVPEEDKKGRLDLRGELVVTIDGADAKDLDDAVSVSRTEDGYRLSVHIADVSHYVTEGSALDESALSRGTSVYLINKVVPMLPHKLSNGICSLNAGVDRLALSCMMTVDREGKIVDHTIDETLINVTRRMTYDEVAEIIALFGENRSEENPGITVDELEAKKKEYALEYGELIPMFLDMKNLSDILRAARVKRGAVDFNFDESKVILDENDAPVDIFPDKRNDASKIIEDFMLAANETVAEDYFWQECPFVYRVHEKPDEEKIEKLLIFVKNFGLSIKGSKSEIHPKEIQKMINGIKGKDEEALISRLTLRSMKQARYSTECDGHFGLATKYYCHFTSPIRRYPDLQIHRIIKENLNGTLDEHRKNQYNRVLDDVAKQTSASERNAESAEREIVRMKQIEFMKNHVGEAYEGVISGLTNWGIYVELPNTVEGMVSLAELRDDFYTFDQKSYLLVGEKKHKVYALGQKVYIEVLDANKALKTIDFKIIGEKRFRALNGEGEENG